MTDNLPIDPSKEPKPEGVKGRALAILDTKVSLQSVGTAVATITTRPVKALARKLGIYVGPLDGAPDEKAVLKTMPKDSKVVLKRDGTVLIGMPEAGNKSVADLLKLAIERKVALSDMSVTRKQLSLLNFNRRTIENADFRESTLNGVDFVRATLKGTDFRRAILTGTCFEGADLRDCDFTGTSFKKSEGDTYASRTDFAYADLTGARFSINADLSHCRFDKARLDGVILVDGRGNVVEGANLTEDGQIVYDTIIGAPAEGDAPAADEKAEPALPAGVYTGLVNRRASLRNSGGEMFSFRYAPEERGSNFGGKDLNYQGSVFEKTAFKGANFTNGNLKDVDFTDSTISSIKWAGADLTRANFSRVTFVYGGNIDFTNTNLTDAILPVTLNFDGKGLDKAKGVETVKIADRNGKVIEGAKLANSDDGWAVDYSAVADLEAYDIPRPLDGVPDMKAALKGLPKGSAVLLDRDGKRLLALPAKSADAPANRADALKQAIERRVTLDGLSYTEAEVKNTHFSGISLKRADLRKTAIHTADFIKAALDGADFGGGLIEECSFERASLRGADFTGVSFKGDGKYGTDFSGADLEGARFSHDAAFKHMRFDHANLNGVVIVDDAGQPIPGAVLTRDGQVMYLGEDATPDAALLGTYDANFVTDYEKLPRWRNSKEDMRWTNYTGRSFKGGGFREGADYRYSSFIGASFVDQQAKSGSNYSGVSFAGSSFKSMVFGAVDLTGADFSGISLQRPGKGAALRFYRSKLEGARFAVSTDFSLVKFEECSPKDITLVDDKGEVVKKARMIEVNGEWAVDLSKVADRPDLQTARQLKGLPDPTQVAANLPEGSKVIMRTDGTLLAALPNAAQKKYRDVLDEAIKRKLDLSHMSYRELTLEAINLNTQTLAGADFTESKVHKADFVRGKMEKACFRDAQLTSVVFDEADLRGADFTGASFRRADYAPFCRFIDADLRGAKFSYDVDLSKAQLHGAKLDGVQIIDADGQVIEGASLSHEGKVLFANAPEAQDADGAERPKPVRNTVMDYRWSDWSGQNLRESGFKEKSDFTEAKFDNAKFYSFNFRGVNCHKASFVGANLRSVSLASCDLREADFTGIDWSACQSVSMEGADLRGAKFSIDADLSLLKLKNAKLDGVVFVAADGAPVADRELTVEGKIRDISPAGLEAERIAKEEAEKAAADAKAKAEEEKGKDALIAELKREKAAAEKAARNAIGKMGEMEKDARLGRMLRDHRGHNGRYR